MKRQRLLHEYNDVLFSKADYQGNMVLGWKTILLKIIDSPNKIQIIKRF